MYAAAEPLIKKMRDTNLHAIIFATTKAMAATTAEMTRSLGDLFVKAGVLR
jgi:hypothetical protein